MNLSVVLGWLKSNIYTVIFLVVMIAAAASMPFVSGKMNAAVKEVYKTFAIAMLLVVGVIYLFLGTRRAAIIPAVTVPICVVATFSVLAMAGYSINLLTLLALILSIGLVVDDSIVVLENIQRRIELGEAPLLAAYRGAREVGFAVIATTLVVIAVFVPIAFLEGLTGRLFRELAVTISAAVAFSSFVALSPSRRRWKSLIITRAPSSTARCAVTKPMPVPAAAVMSSVLPSRSPWPGVHGGAVRLIAAPAAGPGPARR